ncbi:hypothetical protein BP5796_04304 [Coleophoma crateriformis]|uniref:Xylanolytic transcriptional activator regulatory domain-containing protein n=1 Tax=Coleophoma crateriformis TaxID=565419 RepID=A0A3D8SI18_9HELO|nr:hypothetical protein BP5796_04304 [Coleophoma crateriformis]
MNLHARVHTLEEQLKQLQGAPALPVAVAEEFAGPTPSQSGSVQAHPADLAESVAEEVGNLTLGSVTNMSQRYVGTAAGASFTRIFFHQLGLDLHGSQLYPLEQPALGSYPGPLDSLLSRASLPSKAVSQLLLSYYITRVHLLWPIFHLPDLRKWFHQIYAEPRACNSYHRFVIFMILALGAYEAAGSSNYERHHDIFSPEEYYLTSMTFYEDASMGTNIHSLQATLLLTLWMTRVSKVADNAHLWQVSRFAMSMAIELGCHRNNPRWEFGSVEREIRNRVWWTTYGLERMIAVVTGRVLSLRNQAIDARFPRLTRDDALTDMERALSPTFAEKGFLLAIHLFRLRSISGDILESVYVGRRRAGIVPSEADLSSMVDGLRQRLTRWYAIVDEIALHGSKESLELRIEFCIQVLLLNRPSPSFPTPSDQAVEICTEASREALECWAALMERRETVEIWCTFHDVLLVSLVWLYCVWRIPTLEESVVTHVCAIANKVLQQTAGSDSTKRKYLHLFDKVQGFVIEKCQQRHSEPLELVDIGVLDFLSMNWMDECFDDVFQKWNTAFDPDFAMDEQLFDIPEDDTTNPD